ncbi:helix-turn-helix transcriptional regulator [Alicyclobacillus sp. SO9]|uniref:ArsR/SmtB family transcription factor n=1 Tax=Alicyclobacillus sp. SO9 TaxID=2665646 RepID=UPI0018E8516F|nr:metalloregulator ArsR/SmtB family transcription factor [Alicyclobacillus sp. SO9]QQE77106.1 winged helix-turn-helix transcriptional regulator [Alicyclobacillus sp. SO9]
MSVIKDQSRDDRLRKVVHVEVAQYFETFSSLHVLTRPDHHPFRLEWAHEVRTLLPATLMSEIHMLGEITDQWLALLDLHRSEERNGSIKTTLSRLNTMPDAELIVTLLNQRFSLGQVLLALHSDSERKHMPISEAQRFLFTNLPTIRRRISHCIEHYYDIHFQKEWTRIEPWLVQASREFFDKLRENPTHALGELHPRLHIKEDAIYAQKAELYRWSYDEIQRIDIRPTTFIDPHLLIGINSERLSFALPVHVPGISKNEEVPSDLVRMFKVLADSTRLKIVRSLYEQPYCTQQLAHIHNISEAAISKHLRQLQEANFISSRRRGNYVFYQLETKEMELLIVYLRSFLEQ